MSNKIISCDIHDHFEIACMRSSNITLELHDGQQFSGIAKDIETKNKNEFLHLQIDQGGTPLKINLLEIRTMNFEGGETINVSSSSCSI